MLRSRLLLLTLAFALLAALGAGCTVVTSGCGVGLTDCGGYCADLAAEETDCGACGAACRIGDYCDRGLCIVGACRADGATCGYDSDCCSNYCASDGRCGCIPTGYPGCASASDCCSNFCGRDGVCHP